MNREEKAVEIKRSCNCCQAVMLAYADKIDIDEETLKKTGAGFGTGMGCMGATCGALCGAVAVAGLINNTGKPATMLSREIFKEFERLCGATICGDLKGIKSGKVLCSCDNCVRNAVSALESVMKAH